MRLVILLLIAGCSFDTDAVDRPCDDDGSCPGSGLCHLGRCLSCGPQLVDNPGFELGVNGWEPLSSATLDSSLMGHDSDHSLRVCPGGNDFGVQNSMNLPLPPPGTFLQLSSWIRLEAAGAGAVIPEIEEIRGPGNNHHHGSTVPLSSTDWQLVTATVDLTAMPIDRDSTALRVLDYWNGFPAGSTCILVDDMDFRVCK